jgi:phage shock protein C
MNAQKKLYRSRKNRVIAGVCAGLADYFNIDAWIVRLIFLAFLFADGIAAVAYIVLMIIVSEEPGENPEAVHTETPTPTSRFSDRRTVFAVIIICVGVVFLLKQILPWQWFDAHIFWPIVAVAVGIFLIIKK